MACRREHIKSFESSVKLTAFVTNKVYLNFLYNMSVKQKLKKVKPRPQPVAAADLYGNIGPLARRVQTSERQGHRLFLMTLLIG